MTLEQFRIFNYILIAAYILGAVLSFIQFKKRDTYIKLVGVFCLACVIGDLSSLLLFNIKINPNYAASVFQILALPIISSLYYLAIGKSHKSKLISIAVLYVSFGVTNLLVIQKKDINSYTLILLSIIVLFYCLYYFYWLLKELPTIHLHRLPMFWINSGFMVYHSGNLFLFVFTSYLVQVLKDNLMIYWSLHNFLGIIEFSLIISALYIDLRNIKTQS